jgi:hypothetical protein
MLKDSRVLRRACAYRNIFEDVIHQWKRRPVFISLGRSVGDGDHPFFDVASARVLEKSLVAMRCSLLLIIQTAPGHKKAK